MHKQQTEWAEDVLRLGIQFGQELDAAGPLFGWLGRARVETGRYGEAIGLLRRALALGGDPLSLHADLARCFFERGRYCAALSCLDAAEAAGDTSEPLRTLRTSVQAALGDAYLSYSALFEPGDAFAALDKRTVRADGDGGDADRVEQADQAARAGRTGATRGTPQA